MLELSVLTPSPIIAEQLINVLPYHRVPLVEKSMVLQEMQDVIRRYRQRDLI